jgi:hypothetical protein
MARVKTTARAYRLGCGCVTEFSSLPAVSAVRVLCGSCADQTTICWRYPDSSCAAMCRVDKPGGGVTRVRCTLERDHEGRHYDASVKISYTTPRGFGPPHEKRTG